MPTITRFVVAFFVRPACAARLLAALLGLAGTVARAQAPAWQAAVSLPAGDVAATAVDANDDVYVVGYFSGSASIGRFQLVGTAGVRSGYVAKWNAARQAFVWARNFVSSAGVQATSVAAGSGSVYVGGTFSGTTLTVGRSVLTNATFGGGNADAFVAKFSDDGTDAWALRAGGDGVDNICSLASSGSSVYVAGTFAGYNATVGNNGFSNAGPPGTTDGFVAKLTDAGSNGSWTWARHLGGAANDVAQGVAVSGANVYVAGTYQSPMAYFANLVLVNANPAGTSADGFVAKLTDTGSSASFGWALRGGGAAADSFTSLGVSGSSVYVVGSSGTQATYGSTVLAAGGLLLAKITDAGPSAGFAWAQTTPGASAGALVVQGSSLYVGGSFGGTVAFGSTTLSSVGPQNVLVAGLADTGSGATYTWAQQGRSTAAATVSAGALSVAPNGAVYVGGLATAPVSFGSTAVPRVGTAANFFAVLAPVGPMLSLAAPGYANVGSPVALYGSNLTGTTAVAFGGPAGNVVSSGFSVAADGSSISGIVVPAGAQSGYVSVTTPAGRSNPVYFSVSASGGPAPAWQTAVPLTAYVSASAVDAAGNVVLAGGFSGTVAFGASTLTALGYASDLFVAKWNPTTNAFVWAQQAGGGGYDSPTGVAVNGANVYVSGTFSGATAAFGPVTLTNAGTVGTTDGFVAKLTDTGSSAAWTWAVPGGGTATDYFAALAVSGSAVYAAGEYYGPTFALGSTVLSLSSIADAFVARLTDAGSTASVEWVLRAGGSAGMFTMVRSLVAQGNAVYVGGTFSGSVPFGTTTLTGTNVAGGGEAFVARVTDAGSSASFAWALGSRSTIASDVTALAVSGSSVYAAGFFGASATLFGSAPLTSVVSTTNMFTSATDMFVAKLTDAGSSASLAWVQRAGGAGYERPASLAVRGASVYVVGYFSAPVTTFGAFAVPNADPNGSTLDAFVTRLDDAGASSRFAWALAGGGGGDDYAATVALSGSRVVVAGVVTPPAALGSHAFLTPTASTVGFLASFIDLALGTAAPAPPHEPLALYPNPARRAATLALPAAPVPRPVLIFDAMGREVRRAVLPAQAHELPLNVAGLASGVYVVRCGPAAGQLVVE